MGEFSWMAWIMGGVSLPILAIRRFLPPSILASNARLLLVVTITLSAAGVIGLSKFTALLDNPAFIALGSFSLAFPIWLIMLGMQRVGAPAARVQISTGLDERVLSEAMKRPAVLLSLLMVTLVTCAIVYAAMAWPLLSPSLKNSSNDRAVLAVIVCFCSGGLLGGFSRLSRREPPKLRPIIFSGALLLASIMSAALSHWPVILIFLPPLGLAYVWTRTLREAAEILRVDLRRTLRRRIAYWLLTCCGVGSLFAGLLAFSLMRGEMNGHLNAWLRGSLPAIILLLSAATIAWILRRAPRNLAGNESHNEPWFDFPGLELLPFVLPADDATVIENAYDIPENKRREFFTTMTEIERIRLEEGAIWWTLTQDTEHPTVYHEFFQVESWAEYQLALKEECQTSRNLKQSAFAANDWESMPAQITYPALSAKKRAALSGHNPEGKLKSKGSLKIKNSGDADPKISNG